MNDGTQTPECGQINSSVVKSSNENPREQYTFPLTAVRLGKRQNYQNSPHM